MPNKPMRELEGPRVVRCVVHELRWVKDFLYFDGPLISHFISDRSGDYLYVWCDCDERANRWMVFRVSDETIKRLEACESVPVLLDTIIPSACLDGFVYIVDVGSHGAIRLIRSVQLDKIPEDYKPRSGAVLDAV
jgi:hypothetical protein